ncbi:MAG: hypothetical protein KC917_23665, partial [Candidatus Omnitrophica bacterium]|nr:hypothetical protein [Candidatus Omnitrophota bacterium]
MVKIFSIFLPPIAIPMLAGLVSAKVSNIGGLMGLLLGMVVGLAGFVLGQFFETFAFFNDNRYMIPCTVGSSLVGIFLGTLIAPSTEAEEARILRFFSTMETGIRDEEIEESSTEGEKQTAVSPLPVIGFSIGALGAVLFVMMFFTASIREGWVSMTVGLGLML